jgi:hypothetical protein
MDQKVSGLNPDTITDRRNKHVKPSKMFDLALFFVLGMSKRDKFINILANNPVSLFEAGKRVTEYSFF